MAKVKRDLSQIRRALETIAVVREIVEEDLSALRGQEPNARHWAQVCSLALRAIRTAQSQLSRADLGIGGPVGLVDAEALNVLRGFRAIGPRQLDGLLYQRQERDGRRRCKQKKPDRPGAAVCERTGPFLVWQSGQTS